MSKKKQCRLFDYANCDEPACSRCGFNPKEAERRKRHIREEGLTKIGDTRRLIITGRKKA